MTILLHDQHFALTSSSDIDQLSKPLREFFGITSFVYVQKFASGKEIRLSNQPDWIKYFYQHELYASSVFEQPWSSYQRTQLLWSQLTSHQVVLQGARTFNIDHGLTLVRPQSDSCEFYFLGTTPDNSSITSLYFSHLDLIDKFLDYFKEQAGKIIQQAKQQAIILPPSPQAPPLVSAFDREAFLQTLHPQRSLLSPREQDCIQLLVKGYSNKMIAQELQLSTRTIETHLDNIKRKTNSPNKAALLRYLHR